VREDAQPAERHPYRMKDLCDKTGLDRQTIHFYIAEGLVPEGKKTGRNMAWYGDEHLERLRLIRQLQEERFLPLKAIRAVLDEQDEHFTDAQRRLLDDVKRHLSRPRGPFAPGEAAPPVDARPLLTRLGLDRRDLEELAEAGLVALHAQRGQLLVAADDVWLLELWGQMRRAGFTRALGFGAPDLALFAETMGDLFGKETQLLTERLSGHPPARVAEMVERALPIINQFLVRYHERLVRGFLAAG
jgi:DNA-binding transcriptional MerR regulator